MRIQQTNESSTIKIINVMNKLPFLLIALVFMVFNNSRLVGQNIIVKDMKSQATVQTNFDKQSSVNQSFFQPVDTSKPVLIYKTGDRNSSERADTALINYLTIDKTMKIKLPDATGEDTVNDFSSGPRDTADVKMKKYNHVLNKWVPGSK